MFKLKNEYPLEFLLKKIKLNARALFISYAILIAGSSFSGIRLLLGETSVVFFAFFLAGIPLLFISPFLLVSYFKNKKDRYSVFSLVANGAADCMSEMDAKINGSESLSDRLSISNEYIFNLKSSFYIPFALPLCDVAVVYFSFLKGFQELCVTTKKNGTYRFPVGSKAILLNTLKPQKFTSFVFSRIQHYAPDVVIGRYG